MGERIVFRDWFAECDPDTSFGMRWPRHLGSVRAPNAISGGATIVALFPTTLGWKAEPEGDITMRRIISVAILIWLLVVPITGATADEEAVRSGTILAGPISGLAGGYPRECSMTADCLAWLASGCDESLAGRDPALEASIEDVADLAPHNIFSIFEHAAGAAAYATVQFWRQDCTEIGTTKAEPGKVFLEIPPTARWMTVTGYTYNPWATWPPVPNVSGPLTLNWTLTAYQRSESPSTPPSPGEPSEPASDWDGEERSVALGLRGHLRAAGKVVSNEQACRGDVSVVIQRKGSRGWMDVDSSTTDADGAFVLRLRDRGGRYRAVTPEVASPDGMCPETKSSPSPHRH